MSKSNQISPDFSMMNQLPVPQVVTFPAGNSQQESIYPAPAARATKQLRGDSQNISRGLTRDVWLEFCTDLCCLFCNMQTASNLLRKFIY